MEQLKQTTEVLPKPSRESAQDFLDRYKGRGREHVGLLGERGSYTPRNRNVDIGHVARQGAVIDTGSQDRPIQVPTRSIN